MASFNMFVGTMLFYVLLSYVVMPLVFYYYVEKTLLSAGNGFVAGKQKPAGGGGDCHLGHCSGHGALSGQREKIDLRPGVPCTQAIDKCELSNYPDLRGLRP